VRVRLQAGTGFSPSDLSTATAFDLVSYRSPLEEGSRLNLAGSRLVAKFYRFLFESESIEFGFQLAHHAARIAYEVVS